MVNLIRVGTVHDTWAFGRFSLFISRNFHAVAVAVSTAIPSIRFPFGIDAQYNYSSRTCSSGTTYRFYNKHIYIYMRVLYSLSHNIIICTRVYNTYYCCIFALAKSVLILLQNTRSVALLCILYHIILYCPRLNSSAAAAVFLRNRAGDSQRERHIRV